MDKIDKIIIDLGNKSIDKEVAKQLILKLVENRKKTLYAFMYNPCVPEGVGITMSIHSSKEGAEKAMEKHKKKEYKEWLLFDADRKREDFEFYEKYPIKFGHNEDWSVKKIKVKP